VQAGKHHKKKKRDKTHKYFSWDASVHSHFLERGNIVKRFSGPMEYESGRSQTNTQLSMAVFLRSQESKYRPFTSSPIRAKSHFEVFSGSDFHENPIEGTSTSASIWHAARVPVNRKCLAESSYFTASPVDFQTILKVMRAGVATESSAGQRGWSTTETLRISSVKVLPSGLMVSPRSGTGTTQ
jgi:hypothetical protein